MNYQSNPINSMASQYTTGSGAYPTPAGVVTSLAPLDELERQLEMARERVMRACRDVGSVADTLFGEIPGSLGKDGATAPFTGRLGSLNRQADAINAYITELEGQIARLAPLYPPTQTSGSR